MDSRCVSNRCVSRGVINQVSRSYQYQGSNNYGLESSTLIPNAILSIHVNRARCKDTGTCRLNIPIVVFTFSTGYLRLRSQEPKNYHLRPVPVNQKPSLSPSKLGTARFRDYSRCVLDVTWFGQNFHVLENLHMLFIVSCHYK